MASSVAATSSQPLSQQLIVSNQILDAAWGRFSNASHCYQQDYKAWVDVSKRIQEINGGGSRDVAKAFLQRLDVQVCEDKVRHDECAGAVREAIKGVREILQRSEFFSAPEGEDLT
jgi:hypothetical protein